MGGHKGRPRQMAWADAFQEGRPIDSRRRRRRRRANSIDGMIQVPAPYGVSEAYCEGQSDGSREGPAGPVNVTSSPKRYSGFVGRV